MDGFRIRTGGVARRAAVAACFALALAGAGAAAAQEEHGDEDHTHVVEATLVEELPVTDGRLDEEVWAVAGRVGGFIQTEPQNGEPATMPTEVLIAYTREALLIGARMADPDPAAVVSREYRRDANLDSDDNFMVVLDTYHDHRSAFFFSTNAVGTRQDGLVQGEGGDVNNEWDGVWSVGSRRTESGWTTEMVIPFETLRFPQGTPEFGINFGRQVARSREQSFWAPMDTGWGFNAMWRISAYGVLHGMEHADPGGRIKLKPFGVAGLSEDAGERDPSADLGLDAKIALSSNLNLDLTVNTDFAQVEADEQQVNLTRFELFFPEKREFFLENAGLFQVGEVTRPFDPPRPCSSSAGGSGSPTTATSCRSSAAPGSPASSAGPMSGPSTSGSRRSRETRRRPAFRRSVSGGMCWTAVPSACSRSTAPRPEGSPTGWPPPISPGRPTAPPPSPVSRPAVRPPGRRGGSPCGASTRRPAAISGT